MNNLRIGYILLVWLPLTKINLEVEACGGAMSQNLGILELFYHDASPQAVDSSLAIELSDLVE